MVGWTRTSQWSTWAVCARCRDQPARHQRLARRGRPCLLRRTECGEAWLSLLERLALSRLLRLRQASAPHHGPGLRQCLAWRGQTVSDQKSKSSTLPTLRWLIQCFEGTTPGSPNCADSPVVVGNVRPAVRQAQRRVHVEANRQRGGEPERRHGDTSHKEGLTTSCSSTLPESSPPRGERRRRSMALDRGRRVGSRRSAARGTGSPRRSEPSHRRLRPT